MLSARRESAERSPAAGSPACDGGTALKAAAVAAAGARIGTLEVMRRVAPALLALATLAAAAVSGASAADKAATPRLVPVVRGLATPVLYTQAPGQPGRFYVVEQGGTIRVVQDGRVQARPFLDIRSRVVSGGEQGLLGLAFSPGYARNGTFYVNYTAAGDGANTVVRYRARNGRALAASAQVILRLPDPYANHNGGHLVFGPDGRLWVGTGDAGSGGDPENRAQNMDSLFGKMLRLDVRRAQPTPEIVALGLRNPWRYSFDRRTGDLWIGDVGQGEIEEIDRWQRPGTGLTNFGWDVYEGRNSFEPKDLGPGTLVQPVAQYTHADGCSVTGGYVYRGKAVPRLAGRYVYGDYCSGRIWSVPVGGGTPRVEPVRVEGLSSFGESLAGELYAVSHSGTIYRFAR
jgi:glucose/arabinose dehydrogenase